MLDTIHADKYYNLWFLLRQTRDLICRAREKELARLGVAGMHSAALFAVKASEKAPTPAEVSRWLVREPHSVSGLLKRMEMKGLISKTKDLERGNSVRVSLTKKGKQHYELSSRREIIHRIFMSLSDTEQQQLKTLLEKLLYKTLEEFQMKRPPFP